MKDLRIVLYTQRGLSLQEFTRERIRSKPSNAVLTSEMSCKRFQYIALVSGLVDRKPFTHVLASTISLSQFLSFIDEVKLLQNTRLVEILGGFIPRELALLLPVVTSLPHLSTMVVYEAPEVLKHLNYDLCLGITIHTSITALEMSGSSRFIPATKVISFGWAWDSSDVSFS
jgi:hypothetical protein